MLVFTTAQLATYNKGQLREACREHGIGYNSLNNDGMRAALAGHASDAGAPVEAAPVPQAPEMPVVQGPVVAPPPPPPVAPAAPVATKPAKEPKAPRPARPEANGVKRPSEGTICAQIWAWCDAQNEAGVRPEAKVLRAALPGLDDTTKTVQFYRWRKFNGIQGR